MAEMSKLFEMLIEDARAIAEEQTGAKLKTERNIEIAKSMLEDDFPINVITKHTGLSEAIIRDLQVDVRKQPVTIR